MRVLIITGGRMDTDFALCFLKKEKFDHIIIVDGALAFWDKVEKNPDIQSKFDHLVGDFDTISPDILEKYIHRTDVTVHRFVPEKDYTDTDIALKLAIQLCQDNGKQEKEAQQARHEIVLLGATGTRADHMLANLQLLEQLYVAGLTGTIIDRHNRIRLIEGQYCLDKDNQFGDYVSLIPISRKLTGVTLKGFKYPLDNHTVYRGESLCVSNELVDHSSQIYIEEGLAWLIESRD
jgi:thiamine pyrophosphokinase